MAWRPAHHMWKLLHGQPAAIQSHIRWTPGQIGRPSCILRRYLAHDVLIQCGHREMGGRIVAAQAQKNRTGFPHLHGPVAGELGLFRVWIPQADSSVVTGRIAAATSSRLHSHPRRTHLSPPHSGARFLPFMEGSGFGPDMSATAWEAQIIGSPLRLLER